MGRRPMAARTTPKHGACEIGPRSAASRLNPVATAQSVSTSSLAVAVAKGTGWRALTRGATQALQIGLKVALARLLTPAHFGLMGMAAVATGVIGLVQDLGLSAALVQRPSLTKEHLSSAFWALLAIGLLLTAIGMAVAPYAALYYHDAAVEPLVRLLSVGFVLSSAGSVHRALLVRGMRFRNLGAVELGSAACGGVTSVALALNGWGVWSLVWGGLVAVCVGTVAVWATHRWRPRWLFKPRAIADLFRFGANVTAANAVQYVNRNGDYAIMGALLGARPVGIYTLAYNIMLVPIVNVAWMINQVLFPALAKVQDDESRFAIGYVKALEYVSTVAFPAAACLFVLAPELVGWAFGPKWAPAARPAQVLCLVGGLQSIQALCGPVFLAKGRPDVLLRLDLAYLPFFLAIVAVGCRWSVNGVVAGYTILCLLFTPLSAYLVLRCAGATWHALRKAVSPSVLMAVLVGTAAVGVKTAAASAGAPAWAVVLWGGAGSASVWVASALVVRRDLFAEALRLLRTRAGGARTYSGAEGAHGHS